jgi:hypothetical protein
VLLQRGSDAAAAYLGIDPECLDVALRKRLAIVYHRGPARLGADHLDQVAQESDAPAAGESAEHVRLLGVRETRDKVAILGQYLGRQGEHRLEAGRPGLDLAHLDPRPGFGVGIIHPAIMSAAGRGRRQRPGPGRRSPQARQGPSITARHLNRGMTERCRGGPRWICMRAGGPSRIDVPWPTPPEREAVSTPMGK